MLAVLCQTGTVTTSTRADEPAAMVEQFSGQLGDLSTFDYLYPGRVIDLGADDSLALIYFRSCLRERILGGQVTVREDESSVRGAVRMSRSPAGCRPDGQRFHHSDRRTSAAMVFRGQTRIEVIDHLAPSFEFSQRFDWLSITEIRSALEVFRLQQPREAIDLSSLNLLLEPGGIYRVETNESFAIFRIDPDARESEGSKPVKLFSKSPDKVIDGDQ